MVTQHCEARRKRLFRNPGRRLRRDELKPGMTLVGTLYGEQHSLEVRGEEGALVFCLGDRRFRSPSAAAQHVTGHSTNGWLFWRVPE